MLATFLAALSFFGTGEMVVVSARCDPPVARPGGWVDIVIVYEFESGWGTTSPLSRGGPRVRVQLDLPGGFAQSGALRAPTGEPRQDPVFGATLHISGSGELRQRVRVPADQAPGRVRIGARTAWVVCDAMGCLPVQVLDLEVTCKVAADGAPGPCATQDWTFDAADCRGLEESGYASRFTIERGTARAGEEVFAVLDLAQRTDRAAGAIALRPESRGNEVSAIADAWSTATRRVMCANGRPYDVTSWIVPFRVAETATGELRLAVDVQLPGAPGAHTSFHTGRAIEVVR